MFKTNKILSFLFVSLFFVPIYLTRSQSASAAATCDVNAAGVNVMYGTAGNDVLTGTPGNDIIFGYHGDDLIDGLGGDDCIIGGPGNDTLWGGSENDMLYGGDISVTYATDDNDTMFGNQGNDLLHGGGGDDYMEGNEDNDELYGEDGNDILWGYGGDDQLFGGAGQDDLRGGSGINDHLDGGSGGAVDFDSCIEAATYIRCEDTDGNGVNLDDADGDGIFDHEDNCPAIANGDQANFDGDFYGDACDPDDDNDGVADWDDAFPFNQQESRDTDGDGIGNNADTDDDNDGQLDVDEAACGSDPLNAASVSPDFDGDSSPDCVDPDDDNDGVADGADVCAQTILPEDEPAQAKKNRFYANASGEFVDGLGNLAGISIAGTGGCSASQIIDAAGLGQGHVKHGISRSALEAWAAAH